MNNESFQIVKNSIEQKRIKNKQLLALQTKELEEIEKEAKLSKLMEQAQLNHEACMRSSLTGSTSDQEVIDSRSNLKDLSNRLQETRENIKFIAETRIKLNHEIGDLTGDITVNRSILCGELAKESYDEMATNKKLNEKLVSGYAAFCKSGHYDRSWNQFILYCFPPPSERDMQPAEEKLKANNDFMRD